MPRDNSGSFYFSPGTEARRDEPALSGHVNQRFDDVRADLNEMVPISRGGTGSGSAAAARTALNVPARGDVYAKAETYSRSQIDDLLNNPSVPPNLPAGINRVGSVLFAVNNSGGTVSYGTPVNGSQIRPSGVTPDGGLTSNPGPPQSGRWISLGQAFAGHATLFVKVAM